MTRKIIILCAVFFLFLYTVWNFYFEALRHDPISAISVKTPRAIGAEAIALGYRPAWSREIMENNLFSPGRTYSEPKPVVIIEPPVYVEPPKRPELALKGIVLDTFGEYVGYIEIDKAKATPMRKGDKLEAIEVVDISSRKVVLQWNGEKIDLSIEKIKTIDDPRYRK